MTKKKLERKFIIYFNPKEKFTIETKKNNNKNIDNIEKLTFVEVKI